MPYFLFYLSLLLLLLALIALAASAYQASLFMNKSVELPIRNLWLFRLSTTCIFGIFCLFVLSFIQFQYFDIAWLQIILVFLLGICSAFILIDSRLSKKIFEDFQGSNQALADANVNMAMLYAQLDALKESLEEQKNQLNTAYIELKETQTQMIIMEKMAALGQLVAGIAHEINTPMGAINASSSTISDILNERMLEFITSINKLNSDSLQILHSLISISLEFKGSLNSKEERTHRRRIEKILDEHGIEQSDTIADMLVDMHIFSDIEQIITHAKSANFLDILNIAYMVLRIYESGRTIQMSTQKVKKIIFALKSFAHIDKENVPTSFDLKENINNVIILYENQIKYGIDLIFNYDDSIPTMHGLADELGQVWTNLIHNALQAMNYKGVLQIDALQDADAVYVKITDNGPGIPKEIEARIFDPFFTTKPAGEGSGMGLHIISKIIQKHKGSINFTSQPGETTFTVGLPKTQAPEESTLQINPDAT